MRLAWDDLPPQMRQALAVLHNAVADAYPDVRGIQITMEPVGAETPPTVDVRTNP